MKENKTKKFMGRIVAGAYYDMQIIRIGTKNRIRDVIRKKIEGIPFDAVEDKKEEKKFEKKYTDIQLFEKLGKLKDKSGIDEDEYEYIKKCWKMASESQKIENRYKTAMLEYVESEKVYTEFLQLIRGIGPVLSANLIKEFGDCKMYDNVAKLWAHTGNHVVGGIAPKKRKGEDLTFSPRLRMFTWKISDSLMKSNKGIYRQVYDTTKEAMLNKEYGKGELKEKYSKPYKEEDIHLSKGHAHNMALRKMRKLFLSHYWSCAREMAGLEVRVPYVEEKLKHKNIITWRKAIKNEPKPKEKVL